MQDVEAFSANKNVYKIPEYRDLLNAHGEIANKLLQYIWFVSNTSPSNPFMGLSEELKKHEAARACGFFNTDKNTLDKVGMDLVKGSMPFVEKAIAYYKRTYVMSPEEMAGKSAMIYQKRVLKHMEDLEALSEIHDPVELEAEAERLKNIGALLRDASNLVKGFTSAVGHAKNVVQEVQEDNDTGGTWMSRMNQEDI